MVKEILRFSQLLFDRIFILRNLAFIFRHGQHLLCSYVFWTNRFLFLEDQDLIQVVQFGMVLICTWRNPF